MKGSHGNQPLRIAACSAAGPGAGACRCEFHPAVARGDPGRAARAGADSARRIEGSVRPQTIRMGERTHTAAHVWRCVCVFVLLPHSFSSPAEPDGAELCSTNADAEKRATAGPITAGKLVEFAGGRQSCGLTTALPHPEIGVAEVVRLLKSQCYSRQSELSRVPLSPKSEFDTALRKAESCYFSPGIFQFSCGV